MVEPDPERSAAATSGCSRNQPFIRARKRCFSKTGRSRSFCKVSSSYGLCRVVDARHFARIAPLLVSPWCRHAKLRFQQKQRQLAAAASTGSTISPRPRQPPRLAPERKAHPSQSRPPDSLGEQARAAPPCSSFRPSSVLAASLLPPPSPAPCGILFRSAIRTRGSSLISAKKLRAARTTRLSSPVGNVGSSELKANACVRFVRLDRQLVALARSAPSAFRSRESRPRAGAEF